MPALGPFTGECQLVQYPFVRETSANSTMQTKSTRILTFILAASSAVLTLAGPSRAADGPSPSAGSADASFWTKPNWLSDLSFTAKEAYDDNVLGVSGLGLPVQTSWVNDLSAKLGISFVPLIGNKDFSALSLTYNPERYSYENTPSENYTAHRVNGVVKWKLDNLSLGIDEAFLYNDGNKLAPIYALNQLAGSAGNQNDKYRNNYAHAVARERRNQFQDRYTIFLQYDGGSFFVRPISSLIDYNLNTYLFNTSNAPYKGYQDYVSRYDLNGGADLGYKLLPNLALTLGYRVGEQQQDQFAPAVNSDRHFSSNNYQRVLLGLEGKPLSWLTLKLAGGPDFRDFNPNTPISNLHTTRYFGEGTATAALPAGQSLTLAYKQWVFVSSTGLVPYTDTSVSLAYHWNLTKQFGFDAGFKYLEANYTLGNDTAGSAPSLRDDIDYVASTGFTYAVTKRFTVSLAYNFDDARNNLNSLTAKFFPDYRDFTHSVTTLGVQYRL